MRTLPETVLRHSRRDSLHHDSLLRLQADSDRRPGGQGGEGERMIATCANCDEVGSTEDMRFCVGCAGWYHEDCALEDDCFSNDLEVSA
jgi:hypothetical protein